MSKSGLAAMVAGMMVVIMAVPASAGGAEVTRAPIVSSPPIVYSLALPGVAGVLVLIALGL